VKNTDKSKVKIPKGSFLIGVHRLNSDDYSDFKATVELGMQVSIYNINIESAGRTNEINDLVRAAFAVYEPGEEPVFIGGNNPEESPEPEPDLNPDPDKGTVGDVNMNGKIDARDYLLLKRAYFGTYTLQCQMSVADINGNGKIDARDYLLLKRAYFGTYTI
ncbi:MAG: dockerin type I repeat-containing protein, partial [Clostridia bacterium]|nr:dockerin type I repeat-containing protein [Clostridia bacterium]